jgi:gamma-glutamylaminecyclotransferase
MARLFAIGTLKRGFALSYALESSRYLGAYRSVERFPLLIAGQWYAPMLLDQPGRGRHILGELYELEDATLAGIDGLESVGQPGNLRITVRVSPVAGGEECEAFAYAKTPALATPVHSGYLIDYQDRRFIPPWKRLEDSPNPG